MVVFKWLLVIIASSGTHYSHRGSLSLIKFTYIKYSNSQLTNAVGLVWHHSNCFPEPHSGEGSFELNSGFYWFLAEQINCPHPDWTAENKQSCCPLLSLHAAFIWLSLLFALLHSHRAHTHILVYWCGFAYNSHFKCVIWQFTQSFYLAAGRAKTLQEITSNHGIKCHILAIIRHKILNSVRSVTLLKKEKKEKKGHLGLGTGKLLSIQMPAGSTLSSPWARHWSSHGL